ncbi:MAG: MDR family MFS transporter [Sarcina sp.]
MNKKRRNVVIALMLVTFLAAFEGTVVSTAMPTIAKDLNGYSLISWVFSAYLLTSAVSTPVYGKLSDLFGRKKILTIGIIIFLIGTTLSGISTTMLYLIISRAIQGLGAGAILTLTYTIIGDLFTVSEKAKMQGWLSTIWGIASVAGPFVGGAILFKLSWHWIFFVNIPFGLIGIYMINANLVENIEKKKATIDYPGVLFLTISIVSLLIACLESSDLKLFVPCLIITIVSIIIFYFIEKKSKEPLVPFHIFTKPIVLSNLVCFIVSMVLIAIQSYLPIYTQNVLGFDPLISGLFLAPISISWFLSSFVLAKTIPKYGDKKNILIANLIIIIGLIIVYLLNQSSGPIVLLIIAMLILGFGFGGVMTTVIIVAQDAVSPKEIGVSTSTTTLIRTLGQTIGVSIFGSVLNVGISNHFKSLGMNYITPNNLDNAQSLFHLSMTEVQSGFFSGIHDIFAALLIISIIALILAILIPNKIKKA